MKDFVVLMASDTFFLKIGHPADPHKSLLSPALSSTPPCPGRAWGKGDSSLGVCWLPCLGWGPDGLASLSPQTVA